jgi:hypothetical protein
MNTELIQINGQDVPVITYRGRRVITLAQMDQVHGRKPGTAKRNFTEHRAKLIRNEDYFQIRSDEVVNLGLDATKDEIRTYSVGRGGKLIVLAESGYLLLVKSFTDDLAWDVQRKLVATYFRAGDQFAISTLFVLPAPKTPRVIFPPEFFTELFRLTGKTPVPTHKARWIAQKIIDLIWRRIEEGVFDTIKLVNPTLPAKSSGKLYRRYKLSQFVAEGKPMEKLIAFVARCTQAMSDFSNWRAFYSQWNAQHPIKRNLPHEVKVTFADDSELLFSFMLEGPVK